MARDLEVRFVGDPKLAFARQTRGRHPSGSWYLELGRMQFEVDLRQFAVGIAVRRDAVSVHAGPFIVSFDRETQ